MQNHFFIQNSHVHIKSFPIFAAYFNLILTNIIKHMKKIITLIVLATFIMVGTYSCKKYEEGPAISLRTKTKRLTGEWKLDKATQDGIDIINSLPKLEQTFEKDGAYSMLNNATPFPGTWEFDDKKENILLKLDGSSDIEKVKIIRLKNDELWFDSEVGTQVVRYYWIPK